MQARMLLQVHDELIFEAPVDEIEKLKEIVPEVMESTIQLDVPLKVDSALWQIMVRNEVSEIHARITRSRRSCSRPCT